MQPNMSLANLDFGGKHIQIYGTQIDPMIKCSDLLIHVLGYKQCKTASWFSGMVNNPKLVTIVNHHGPEATRFFTEKGIYTALMKSNKPAAEKFQDMVCDLLKQIRLQTHNQLAASQQALEETQKQLEEAKRSATEIINKQPASIYTIKRGEEIIYIGQDQSLNQSRIAQHLNERQKIISQYQLIDIVLATMNTVDILIEQQPCLKSDTDELEKSLIREFQPVCNQQHNTAFEVKCAKCSRVYKSRGWLQRHEQRGCGGN